jgi:F420-dependent methylenetetrahydromethanopterin dehydrogenase
MAYKTPRVVIGKIKGVKVRSRHPSEMGGYIYHTFSNIEEAKRYFKDKSSWAKRNAKVTRVDTGQEVKI